MPPNKKKQSTQEVFDKNPLLRRLLGEQNASAGVRRMMARRKERMGLIAERLHAEHEDSAATETVAPQGGG